MAKKLLCVMLSVLMVVAMLPMGIVADDNTVHTIGDIDYTILATQTSANTLTILSGQDFTDESLYLCINYTDIDSTKIGWGGFSICDSNWTNMAVPDVNSYTCLPITEDGYYLVSLVTLASVFETAGSDATEGVILNWFEGYATFASAELLQLPSEDEEDNGSNIISSDNMYSGTTYTDYTMGEDGTSKYIHIVAFFGANCKRKFPLRIDLWKVHKFRGGICARCTGRGGYYPPVIQPGIPDKPVQAI